MAPSNGAYTMRLADLRDAQAIAQIRNEGIEDRTATFLTVPRTAGQVEAGLTERGDRHPTVVVERNGLVVAWAGVGAYRSRPWYGGIGEFSVYVGHDARGFGVGTMALHGLIGACRTRGFWKLVSRLFPGNAASRALYQSLGFREVGICLRHARLDGQWRDCVVVELRIGRPSCLANGLVWAGLFTDMSAHGRESRHRADFQSRVPDPSQAWTAR